MGGRKNFRSRFGLLPLLGRRLLNVRRVQNAGLSEYRKPRIVFVISSKAPVWEIIEKGRARLGA